MKAKINNKANKETDLESASLLHLTDYNNYANLSHFISEYKKAMLLINKCNDFYKSFLSSKLFSFSKILSSYGALNKVMFYNVCIKYNDKFNELANKVNNECVKKIADRHAIDIEFGVFNDYENEKNVIEIYHKKSNLFFKGFRFDVYPKNDKRFDPEEYNKYYDETIKHILMYTKYSSIEQFESAAKKYSSLIEEEYKKEFRKALLKQAFEQVNKWCEFTCFTYIEPHFEYDWTGYRYLIQQDNDMVQSTLDLLNCKDTIKGKGNTGEEIKSVKALAEDYSKIQFNILDIVSKNDIEKYINKVIDNLCLFDNSCRSHCNFNFVNLFEGYTETYSGKILWQDSKNENNKKLFDLVIKKVEPLTSLCYKIANKYEGVSKRYKLYVIHEQTPKFFCYSDEFDKVKIKLSKDNKFLVCTYKNKSESNDFRWNGIKTYVNDIERTLTFDVATNEASDFSEYEHNYNYFEKDLDPDQ